MKTIKIAMAQTPVIYNHIEENLACAKDYISNAANNGSDIIVLPECLDFGWGNKKAIELSHPIPGSTSDFFCEAARTNNIHIVCGITEKSGNLLYNSALLISNKGIILSKHRKINLLKEVEGFCTVGNTLTVTDTIFGKIGLAICADNLEETSHLTKSLATMGAELILSPCAWAVPPTFTQSLTPYGNEWLIPYTSITNNYPVTIISVSNVGFIPSGPWKDWLCIGNSIAMGPGGKLLTALPFGQDAAYMHYLEITL